jgi:hypothetical protein
MDLILMALKFLERIKFKLSGRSVPVILAEDIAATGIVGTLHMVGDLKDRDNSLLNSWDVVGYQKDKYSQRITLIDEKGSAKPCWVVNEAGITTNLYVEPVTTPNLKRLIGASAMLDDLAEAADLGKSQKNLYVGMIVGMLLGAFVLAPMLNAFLA